MVTFQLGDTFFYVRTRQDIGFADYHVSEKIWLEFDQDNIYFFPKTIDLLSKA